jgi:UTP--glucose-1-phosphate uridylyltransferase
MVAAMEVAPEKTSSYGILDVENDGKKLLEVKGMVEKPKADQASSNLAVIGRYILSPNVLRNLDAIKQGAGGEIQLTDAIAAELEQKNKVYGYRFEGQRFDCGSKSGFLQATVAYGLERAELRDDLAGYIKSIAPTL